MIQWVSSKENMYPRPLFRKPCFNFIMSNEFAIFLLDQTNNGNEILQVLDHVYDCVEEEVQTAL